MYDRLRRALTILLVGLGVLLVALLGAYWWQTSHSPAVVPKTTAAIGGPFELVDSTGRTVSSESFRGKWLMIYFGYTSCPDACPTALSDMAAALDQLGAEASKVQALFITVDPERDTPSVLADYVKAFDPRIVGLSGNVEQIAAATKAYKVYYRKQEPEADGSALVEHTSIIYVMDPAGRFVTNFSHETAPEKMAASLRHLLAQS